MVKLDNITFAYPEQPPVLKDLDITFPAGRISVILGRNGSGKTTLMKCIYRAFVPQRGRILLGGEDICQWSHRQIARKVAVVRQETHYVFPYSVLDIVNMGRTPHLNLFQVLREKDREICLRTLSMVGMQAYANKKVSELSSGESQMVLLARALAQCTPILLLDEPNAHLDIYNQVRILQLIARLSKQNGLTVIAVLHNPEIAYWFADQVFMLANGQVKFAGPPRQVMTAEHLSAIYDIPMATQPLSSHYLAMVPKDLLNPKALEQRETEDDVAAPIE